MRKASMILGIVGGSLAIIGSIILVFVGLMVGAVAYRVEYTAAADTQLDSIDNSEADSFIYKTPEGDAVFYMPHGMHGGFFVTRDEWADDEDCPVWEGVTTGSWANIGDRFTPFTAPYSAMAPHFVMGLLFFLAAAGFAGGVLAIVGGAIVNRKTTAGGVLMLVGSVLASNMFAVLLTGGILALVSKKQGSAPTETAA